MSGFITPLAFAQTVYQVTVIDPFTVTPITTPSAGGGVKEWSLAYGINNNGQVVGSAALRTPSPYRGPNPTSQRCGFVWTPTTPNGTVGSKTNLTPPSEIKWQAQFHCEGFAINDLGQVTGQRTIGSENAMPRTFFLTSTNLIPTFNGNWTGPSAINNDGQVVGAQERIWSDSNLPPNEAHYTAAYSFYNGVIEELVCLEGSHRADAYGINDSNQIVGRSDVPSSVEIHAFLRNNSATYDLGTLGGSSSVGYAISQNGKVVGSSTTFEFDQNTTRAFLWTPSLANATSGSMINLGVFPLSIYNDLILRSEAKAVNNSGQVVGRVFAYIPSTGRFEEAAFVWDSQYGLRNLNTVAPLTNSYGSVHYTSATGINDSGQIVANANYYDASGDLQYSRAILLTPAP